MAELGAKAIALAAASFKAYTADLVERALKMVPVHVTSFG